MDFYFEKSYLDILKMATMERKDFIEKVGFGTASLLIFGCMQACSKAETAVAAASNNNGSISPKAVDFTINISIAPYNVLNTLGGYYVDAANNIIIARTLNNEFIAVSSVCTHASVTIEYQATKNLFYCEGHGSTFTNAGAVSNGPAAQPLKQYKTTLTGSNLRIYA
jgi:cytochrome b6-f complex iron-sulfur subunit